MRLLLLLIAATALVAALLILPLDDLENWAWDFSVFRAGSKAMLNGHNPYEPSSVLQFSDGAELASIPYYVYAPFFAVLISPLAILEPWLASRAWFLVNLGACVGSVAAIMAALRWKPHPREFFLIAIGLAIFPPLRTLVVIGQSSGVMLLMLSLGYLLLRSNRSVASGIPLGLALFKPHLVLVPVFLAIRRQWRVVGVLIATLVVASLPFWNLLDDWAISLVRTRADNLGYGCLAFSSLAAFLQCFTDSLSAQVLLISVLLGFGLWMIRDSASPPSILFALQLSFVVALSLLVIDNVRVADLILLIFPILVCLYALKSVEALSLRRVVYGLLLAAYFFPYFAQVFGWVTKQPLLFDMPIWYVSLPLGVFGAIGLMLGSFDSQNEH